MIFRINNSYSVVLAAALAVLSGCVSNPTTKVTMLQAPEVEAAAKYKAISIGRFSGQMGDAFSTDLEAALINAKVQDKPVYRSVARAPEVRSLGDNVRSLASAARSQGAEAVFVGEVTRADVRDERRTEKRTVCDRTENPKKLFSKCVSSHEETIHCIDRAAIMNVQVRLIDAQSSGVVYSEAISKEGKSSGCGRESPTDGRAMLSSLKDQAIADIKKKAIPHDSAMDIELMESDEGVRSDGLRARFKGAVNFAKSGRMDRACETFREINEAERNSIALNYNLGVCEEAAGAFWKASEHYRIADRLSNEPNKLVNQALARNDANIKKAGALAQNRKDLVSGDRIEAGAAPQTIAKSNVVASPQVAPQAPLAISADALMLDKRVALVIGNSAYRRGALRNPVNDARAMAAELRKANFKVIAVEDAGYARMNAAIDEFGRAIRPEGVALVFYAGHGMQVKGENYLLPVDSDLKGENDVPYKTVNLGQILAKLDEAKPRVNIVVLDACRDNPFARSWRSSRGGLASIDAPSGTVVAFATAPGKVAADGDGANGLYTGYFLQQLRIPNQKIEDVLKNTRKAVAAASNNEQVPWDSSSMTGDFYFKVTALQ